MTLTTSELHEQIKVALEGIQRCHYSVADKHYAIVKPPAIALKEATNLATEALSLLSVLATAPCPHIVTDGTSSFCVLPQGGGAEDHPMKVREEPPERLFLVVPPQDVERTQVIFGNGVDVFPSEPLLARPMNSNPSLLGVLKRLLKYLFPPTCWCPNMKDGKCPDCERDMCEQSW